MQADIPSGKRIWMTIPGDWRRPTVQQAFTILWDDAAEFGQILPRPSPSEVQTFYDLEEYYTHDDGAADAGTMFPGQKLLVHLAWRLDHDETMDAPWWQRVLGGTPRRILEVGCGNGANLTILRALGHRVVGVEPDPKARDVARSAGHDVYGGLAEDLPEQVTSGRYDVVLFSHVLEHCLSPSAALSNAVALLDEGGIVVAEVPNNDCRGAAHYGPSWLWLDVPRHLNFFTPTSLQSLCGSCGLDVEQTIFFGYCRQFMPAWTVAQASAARRMGLADKARHSPLSHWRYFLTTALAPDRRKYDSVRVIARKRGGSV